MRRAANLRLSPGYMSRKLKFATQRIINAIMNLFQQVVDSTHLFRWLRTEYKEIQEIIHLGKKELAEINF